MTANGDVRPRIGHVTGVGPPGIGPSVDLRSLHGIIWFVFYALERELYGAARLKVDWAFGAEAERAAGGRQKPAL